MEASSDGAFGREASGDFHGTSLPDTPHRQIARGVSTEQVAEFLLANNFLLSALELLLEAGEAGREAEVAPLAEFFADRTRFPPEELANFEPSDAINLQAQARQREEQLALAQYELRIAREDVSALQGRLESGERVGPHGADGTGDGDGSGSAAGGGSGAGGGCSAGAADRAVINGAIAAYLQQQGYAVTRLTLQEEVGVPLPGPGPGCPALPDCLAAYRERDASRAASAAAEAQAGELAAARAEVEALQARLAEAQGGNRALAADLQFLQAKVDALQEARQALEADKTELSNALQEARERLAKAQGAVLPDGEGEGDAASGGGGRGRAAEAVARPQDARALAASHQELLATVADAIPRLVPGTLVPKRCELLPLLSMAVCEAASPSVRAALVAQLLRLVRRPNPEQAAMLSSAVCDIAARIGPARTARELLPPLAEQSRSRHTERRAFIARAVGGLVGTLGAGDGGCEAVGELGEVLVALAGDHEPSVRVAAARALAECAAPLLAAAPGAYPQVEGCLLRLVADASPDVTDAATEALFPALLKALRCGAANGGGGGVGAADAAGEGSGAGGAHSAGGGSGEGGGGEGAAAGAEADAASAAGAAGHDATARGSDGGGGGGAAGGALHGSDGGAVGGAAGGALHGSLLPALLRSIQGALQRCPYVAGTDSGVLQRGEAELRSVSDGTARQVELLLRMYAKTLPYVRALAVATMPEWAAAATAQASPPENAPTAAATATPAAALPCASDAAAAAGGGAAAAAGDAPAAAAAGAGEAGDGAGAADAAAGAAGSAGVPSGGSAEAEAADRAGGEAGATGADAAAAAAATGAGADAVGGEAAGAASAPPAGGAAAAEGGGEGHAAAPDAAAVGAGAAPRAAAADAGAAAVDAAATAAGAAASGESGWGAAGAVGAASDQMAAVASGAGGAAAAEGAASGADGAGEGPPPVEAGAGEPAPAAAASALPAPPGAPPPPPARAPPPPPAAPHGCSLPHLSNGAPHAAAGGAGGGVPVGPAETEEVVEYQLPNDMGSPRDAVDASGGLPGGRAYSDEQLRAAFGAWVGEPAHMQWDVVEYFVAGALPGILSAARCVAPSPETDALRRRFVGALRLTAALFGPAFTHAAIEPLFLASAGAPDYAVLERSSDHVAEAAAALAPRTPEAGRVGRLAVLPLLLTGVLAPERLEEFVGYCCGAEELGREPWALTHAEEFVGALRFAASFADLQRPLTRTLWRLIPRDGFAQKQCAAIMCTALGPVLTTRQVLKHVLPAVVTLAQDRDARVAASAVRALVQLYGAVRGDANACARVQGELEPLIPNGSHEVQIAALQALKAGAPGYNAAQLEFVLKQVQWVVSTLAERGAAAAGGGGARGPVALREMAGAILEALRAIDACQLLDEALRLHHLTGCMALQAHAELLEPLQRDLLAAMLRDRSLEAEGGAAHHHTPGGGPVQAGTPKAKLAPSGAAPGTPVGGGVGDGAAAAAAAAAPSPKQHPAQLPRRVSTAYSADGGHMGGGGGGGDAGGQSVVAQQAGTFSRMAHDFLSKRNSVGAPSGGAPRGQVSSSMSSFLAKAQQLGAKVRENAMHDS